MPRGFVNGFVPQVVAAVDARTGRFRLTGLRTDHCAVGVLDRPGRVGRELLVDVAVTAGRTTTRDVHDDGRDASGGPPPSPEPAPSSPPPTCLLLCAGPTDVRIGE
jgi:hypothetical protein